MLVYLAAPYNSHDLKIIQKRMETIYGVISRFIKDDVHIVTPLFMHEVVKRYDIAGDYLFWERYCLNILKRCDKMVVLCLDGWEDSLGVQGEIEFCSSHNIPYTLLEANFEDYDGSIREFLQEN